MTKEAVILLSQSSPLVVGGGRRREGGDRRRGGRGGRIRGQSQGGCLRSRRWGLLLMHVVIGG